jgi:hypothetical protein
MLHPNASHGLGFDEYMVPFFVKSVGNPDVLSEIKQC